MNGSAHPPMTLEGYATILDRFADAGYRLTTFDGMNPSFDRQLIVRHDIDFCPDAALAMARKESSLGVRSHYFALVSSPFYDVADPATAKTFQDIAAEGHQIGLHFDAAPWGDDPSRLETEAARECVILEDATGVAVTSISFHRPAQALLEWEGDLAGRLHAYQSRFFRDIAYFSDSGGRFRFGHPLDSDAFASGRRMQLLIHPIWWGSDAVADPMMRLETLLEGRGNHLRGVARANCKPFGEWDDGRSRT